MILQNAKYFKCRFENSFLFSSVLVRTEILMQQKMPRSVLHKTNCTGIKNSRGKERRSCREEGQNNMRNLGDHTGERTKKCKRDDKCFSEAIKSSGIHTGKRPYKFKQCGKCFRSVGHLKRHERIHTGEKPYKCKQCGKCFSQGQNLRIHERTHTGEKPHKCKQFGKCFGRAFYLRRHENTHTGESIKERSLNHHEKHSCWICQEELSSEPGLLEHYQNHMKLEEPSI